MKLNIYGLFQLDVQRENDSWVAYRLDPGKRVKVNDFAIPSTLGVDEIATYLDDLFHELAGPGQSVEVLS